MLSRINETQHGPRTLGYRIEGDVEPSSFRAMGEEIDRSVEKNGETAVLVELREPELASPQAFWEALRRSVKRVDGLRRVAVVADDSRFGAAEIARPAGAWAVRWFPPADERHAWRWAATGETQLPGEDEEHPAEDTHVDVREPRPMES